MTNLNLTENELKKYVKNILIPVDKFERIAVLSGCWHDKIRINEEIMYDIDMLPFKIQ